GVDRQIHDDLFELTAISADAAELTTRFEDLTDIFGDQAGEHLAEFLNDGIQIQHFELDDLLAAKRQELAGHAGGAFGGVEDFLGVFPERTVVGELFDEEFGVALNDADDVVEVVGYAASEAADGLQFSRKKELAFETLLLAEVVVKSEDADELAADVQR